MSSTNNCSKTAFTKKHVIDETQNIVFITFLGILVPITIVTNSLLAFALIKTRQLMKNVSNIFIFLLCLSDTFLGAVTIPFVMIIFAKYRHARFCTLEFVAAFILSFSTHMSANVIVVIALHRYIQVSPDFQGSAAGNAIRRWLISKTGSIVLVFLAFLLAVANGLLSINCFGIYYNRVPNWIIKGIDCVLVMTVVVLYMRLFCRIRGHTQVNSVLWRAENIVAVSQTSSASDGHSVAVRPKYFVKFAKTVLLILIAIALCYLPFIVVDVYTAWMGDIQRMSSARLVRFLYFMSWGPAFINSTVNAAIIIYRNDKLKAFLKEKILHCSQSTPSV